LQPIDRGLAAPGGTPTPHSGGCFGSSKTAPLSDALTVADNTAGPNGTIIAADERRREKRRRHRPDSPNARANPERDEYIRAADRRVAHRLAILNRPHGNLGNVDEQPGDRH